MVVGIEDAPATVSIEIDTNLPVSHVSPVQAVHGLVGVCVPSHIQVDAVPAFVVAARSHKADSSGVASAFNEANSGGDGGKFLICPRNF